MQIVKRRRTSRVFSFKVTASRPNPSSFIFMGKEVCVCVRESLLVFYDYLSLLTHTYTHGVEGMVAMVDRTFSDAFSRTN